MKPATKARNAAKALARSRRTNALNRARRLRQLHGRQRGRWSS